MVVVEIVESESGWGQKVDHILEFKDEDLADQFCRKYNTKHNPPGQTPSWYMFARIKGDSVFSGMRR